MTVYSKRIEAQLKTLGEKNEAKKMEVRPFRLALLDDISWSTHTAGFIT